MKKIEIPQHEWKQTPNITPTVTKIIGGLNQNSPIDIEDNQLTKAVNVEPRNALYLEVREGSILLGPDDGTYTTMLRKYQDKYIRGSKIGLHFLNANTWNAIQALPVDNRYYQAVEYKSQNVLVIVDGKTRPKKYNGTTLTDITAAPNMSKWVTVYANRLYMAGDPSNPNTLYYNALRKVDDWTTVNDAGSIIIETNDGQSITALTTYVNHVVVFKSNSFHELYGTGPSNFRLVDGSNTVGCIAGRTLAEVGDALFWLGHNGVYQYGGGKIPDYPISTAINDYILDLDWTRLDECVGGTDGTRYVISLVTKSYGTKTLVYDLKAKGWFEMNYIATAFLHEGEKWHIGTATKTLTMDQGLTENGLPIPWNLTTKAFSDGDETKKKKWQKLWLVVDAKQGTNLEIFLSPEARGEDSWVSVKTYTAITDVQSLRILVPVNVVSNAIWARLRIVGTGHCSIHRIVREVRAMGDVT